MTIYCSVKKYLKKRKKSDGSRYNCPRAATVKAKDDGKYWKLDRESFSNIVQDAAMKKRDKSAWVGCFWECCVW